MFVAKSTDARRRFGKPVRVAPIYPYDQGTSLTSFRSNGFQTMAIDADRAASTWPGPNAATRRCGPIPSPATRASSSRRRRPGRPGRCPQAIRTDGLGHEVMPALSFQAGRLRHRLLRSARRRLAGLRSVRRRGAHPRTPIPSRCDTRSTSMWRRPRPAAAPMFTAVRLSDYADRLPAWLRHAAAAAVQSAEPAALPAGHRAVHGGLPRSGAGAGDSCRARTVSGLQHATDRQRRRARLLDRQPRRPAAGRRQLAELHAGDVATRCRATASSIRTRSRRRAWPATPACAIRTSTPRA